MFRLELSPIIGGFQPLVIMRQITIVMRQVVSYTSRYTSKGGTMYAFRSMLIVTCLISITGCGSSHFADRQTNPVVIDDTNNNRFWNAEIFDSESFTTFSTTASRRMIVVLQAKDKTEICSEPSPDVGEAFASAVADNLKIGIPSEAGASAEVSNQYAKAVATQIASLIHRTQGLQLYRNAIHSLCVDRMNGWLENKIDSNDAEKPKSYDEYRKYYFDKSIALIEKEINNIKDISSIKAGQNLDSIIDKTAQLLKAANPKSEESK